MFRFLFPQTIPQGAEYLQLPPFGYGTIERRECRTFWEGYLHVRVWGHGVLLVVGRYDTQCSGVTKWNFGYRCRSYSVGRILGRYRTEGLRV